MQANHLYRLSRANLSNAQLLVSSASSTPGHHRFPSDVWRFLLVHEQLPLNPHPDTTAPAHNADIIPKIIWQQEYPEIIYSVNSKQSQGSFGARAPSASIGVAEMAAALAVATFDPMHAPEFAQSLQLLASRMSIQSSFLGSAPASIVDKTFSRQLTTHMPGPVPTTIAPLSSITPLLPSFAPSPPNFISGPLTSSMPMPQLLHPGCPTPPSAVDISEPATEDVELPNTLREGSTALRATAAVTTTAAAVIASDDYLPQRLRSLVPTSLARYWREVKYATRNGRLHATIYISRKSWAQVAGTVTAMLGANGAGPADQVQFALVPLGADYAARADSAQQVQLDDVGSVRWTIAAAAADSFMEEVAARFGLDVALAASAALSGPTSRSVRRLEMCPGLRVRGGYMGQDGGSGEVSPAWCMRQDLDCHVRRNLSYVQLLRQRHASQEMQQQQRRQADEGVQGDEVDARLLLWGT